MPPVFETARKLLVAPILCAAVAAVALPSNAMAASSDKGACVSGAKAKADDHRPAGHGGGRKVR